MNVPAGTLARPLSGEAWGMVVLTFAAAGISIGLSRIVFRPRWPDTVVPQAKWFPEMSQAPTRPTDISAMVSWLKLIRVPNLATAIADPLAGFLIAGGYQYENLPVGGWLAIASSFCLYAGGIIQNDVVDFRVDQKSVPIDHFQAGVSPLNSLDLYPLDFSFSVLSWRVSPQRLCMMPLLPLSG